jgi:hypothetical protein
MEGVDEMRELARAAAHFDRLVLRERDARGVVTAILQASQSVEENRNDRFWS